MVGHVAVFIVETDKQQYGEAHGLRGVLRELHAAEILRRGLRLRDEGQDKPIFLIVLDAQVRLDFVYRDGHGQASSPSGAAAMRPAVRRAASRALKLSFSAATVVASLSAM